MSRLKPIRRTINGITEHRVVDRGDFPDTTEGNAALLADTNAGNRPILALPDAGAVVGTYSYAFSRAGTDAGGRPMIDKPAPVLAAAARQSPRLPLGNDFDHPIQTALNTFLAARYPAFAIPWLVTYAGVGFALTADRSPILSRGYGAIAENMPNRGLYSRTKLAILLPGGYDLANTKADQLAAVDSGDARIPWLRGWKGTGSTHYLIDNQAAAQAFGAKAYSDYQNSDWTNGSPLLAITPNFEVYTASPDSGNGAEQQWRNMLGWFMQGFHAEAVSRSQTPAALIMYDWASMCHYSMIMRSRDQQVSGSYTDLEPAVSYNPEVGVPFYFSYASIGDNFRGGGSKTAPLQAGNPYSQYLKDNGGYAGSAEYMRNTWDDQSFWQKNTDGTFKTRVVGGVTLLVPRTDARRTSIGGEVCDILGAGRYSVGEGDNFLSLAYQRRQETIVNVVLRAGGKHQPTSLDRQTGWENLKLVQWARLDAEFKQTNEVTKPDNSGPAINPATGVAYDVGALNSRPLNPDFLVADILLNCLRGIDCYRFWMGPEPELSAQGVTASSLHTRASSEVAQKAMYRLAQFSWIKTNTIQYVNPQYLIRNLGRDRSWYDPNEEFEKKADVGAILCNARSDRANKPYVVVFGQYMAQDVTMITPVTYWWVDESGNPVTPGYLMYLVGRRTFADDHELPAAVIGLPPTRMRFQYVDMTGAKHTLTGNYLDAKITDHPVPPATGLPVGTGTSTSTATGTSTSTGTGTGTGTSTSTVSFPIKIQAEVATASGTMNFDGTGDGFSRGPLSSASDYLDFTVSIPSAGTYIIVPRYQTNFDPPASGTASLVIGSGTPIDFTLEAASGGNRSPEITVTLPSGTVHIFVKGKTNTFFLDHLTIKLP